MRRLAFVAAGLVTAVVAAMSATLATMARPAGAAGPGCVEQLSGALDVLSARHWQDDYRAAAAGAEAAAERACAGAPTTAGAATRLVTQLGDPAVRIMDAAHFRRTLEEWLGNPVVGVGLTEVLSIDIDERTGLLTVIAPVPSSPAARAGLRAGDVVTSIDGAATEPLGLTDSMERLRIALGERIGLGVLRGEKTHEIDLQAVELPALEAVVADRLPSAGGEALYLRLAQFIPGAAAKLRSAVLAAKESDAIVLDLRDNPGGLVDELRQAAGLFLAPGTSIARVGGTEPAVLAVAEDAEAVGNPLYVIVGRGTASAAEALAGALQSHGRARLYGERTFGKGLVHETLPLGDDATLMFPSGQLETPGGRRILHDGVEPDVASATPLEVIESELGE